MTEIETKLQRLRAMLDLRQLDAVLLTRSANFAWLTCGANGYVNTATDGASAELLVTPQGHYVLTNNIEATRLRVEERLEDLGFELRIAPWYEANPALAELTHGLRLGVDTARPGTDDVSAAMAALRLVLTHEEGARFAKVGQACAEAMNAAIRRVQPGMNEFQIAGLLADETLARGAVPIVNLIATDERIFNFRHPLPTDRRMEKYAMLVVCGRQYGLVASCTRLVHFGPVPEELERKMYDCALVDATLIGQTRPGARISDIFRACEAAYAGVGYPGEWQLHHQGGPAGYEPREFVGTPTLADAVVIEGQAYAWNPSITGVKAEDTILVGPVSNQVLTEMADWPMIDVELGGVMYHRPGILVA